MQGSVATISISEALSGPAISEWGYPDGEAAATVEAWQLQQQVMASQWLLEGHDDSEQALGTSQEAWKLAVEEPVHWTPWPADAGLQPWPHEDLAAQAAISLAVAAATMAECGVGASAMGPVNKAVSKAAREAAWASPLRVPLPEPLSLDSVSNVELGLELEMLELPPENTFAEPQKISAVSGLRAPSGPGALLAEVRLPAASAKPPTVLGLAAATTTTPAPPGMVISVTEVGGQSCTRVEWKIDDFSGKLQASMGRPVVSPSFSACSLSNLRLMVFPDARDVVKSARSHERKGLYTSMVKKGPLYGSLKLKADGLERATVMTFSLLVGGFRMGPSSYDFSEQAVQGLDDFGVDWLQQVEKPSGALRVSIEIFEVRRK